MPEAPLNLPPAVTFSKYLSDERGMVLPATLGVVSGVAVLCWINCYAPSWEAAIENVLKYWA